MHIFYIYFYANSHTYVHKEKTTFSHLQDSIPKWACTYICTCVYVYMHLYVCTSNCFMIKRYLRIRFKSTILIMPTIESFRLTSTIRFKSTILIMPTIESFRLTSTISIIRLEFSLFEVRGTLPLCAYMYECMYVHMYIYIYICICICIHICMYV